MFLGYDYLTNEYILHSQGRIVKARALQRLSCDQRWSAKALEEVRMTPHDTYQKPEPGVVFGEQAAKEDEEKEKEGREAGRAHEELRWSRQSCGAGEESARWLSRCRAAAAE